MINILYILFIFISSMYFCPAYAETRVNPDPDEAAIKDSEKEQAQEREKEAGEDPLKQRQESKVDTPEEHANEPNDFSPYTSLRVRYRNTGGKGFYDDGGSRVGTNALWQFKPGYWLGGQLELGFNLLNQLDTLFDPGSRSSDGPRDVFARLFYVNLETPNYFVVLGKAWSTYYSVAGFTDRFEGTGASASGTFNAGTDGGPSGTGRADNVLQTRFLIKPSRFLFSSMKPFTLNVQLQHNQEIPYVFDFENGDVEGFNYGYAIGLSALLETRENFNIGVAYNHAQIKDEDQQLLQSIGIDGDDSAFLLGAKWFGKKWYLASNVSWLWNHMTTDQGNYFDGRGWETYAQYNLHKRWWVTGGWNYLKPNKNQDLAGSYLVKYGVLGVRYSLDKFNRLLYMNVRFDGSTGADAEAPGLSNIYTVGFRWDIPR